MKLKIQNKEIEIKVIPVSKYPELLRKIKILPTYFNEMAGKSNNEIFEMFPELVANCLPDVLAVFSVATNVKEEELNEMGMSDLVDILMAIIEENRFVEAVNKIKKGFTQNQEKNKN